ncbi:hypothetical protein J40TS1_02550 [Paenibacillus montaniterrae]|uniref:Uncharacterized protein n=1 Tax=Paenibacillus montaniterrae TaxID=429341 RepID=A0A919YPH1_9BACL|nr:YlzJ-like family protein [Paenibacillus montaniterrae]GIP14613.1 hypothetical protein J40TS1_02550 [Paenibacillus montaniterrae]
MLYSVMPLEFVYREQTPPEHIVDYVYQGLLMEVKPLTTGKAMIVRLINPPLDCYLDEKLAPGALIPFQQ